MTRDKETRDKKTPDKKTLVEKIIELHTALRAAEMPHAFGGALALAWCTQAARATIDIDVNLFVDAEAAEAVFASLPAEVETPETALAQLQRDTQIRLWWQHTPVDIFLNSTPFHAEVSRRVRWELLGGTELPFLCCEDLAVFKAFFNRTKDWADLEEMQAAGTLNPSTVASVIAHYLGTDDERVARLQALGEHG